MMSDIESRVRSVMVKVFQIDPGDLPAEASREHLSKWDSLRHMNLVLALEDEFGFEFSDKEISALTNLVHIVENIEDRQA